MPNILAHFVFLLWPFLVFYFLSKHEIKKAIFVSFLFSFLWLPASYRLDLPLLPVITKTSLTAFLLIICLTFKSRGLSISKYFKSSYIILLYLASLIGTSLTNSEPVFTSVGILPGLTMYDAISVMFASIMFFAPYQLARYFSRDMADTEIYFKILVSSALIYSFLALYEVRMSPQIHTMIYGYFPRSFAQQYRDGGFRPVVFMGHGLLVANFFSTVIIATYTLIRNKIQMSKTVSNGLLFTYFLVILVLCKSLAPLMYAILGITLIKFVRPFKLVAVALTLSLSCLMYPLLKSNEVIPEQDLLRFIETNISADRAQSLEFRLENEAALLDKAKIKPLFGWGGWGRNRIYNDDRDTSTTDGLWIIQIGANGYIGFALTYALLIMPIYIAWRNFKYITDKKNQVYISSLCLIISLFILDTIPNDGTGNPMYFLFAGALLGQTESLKRKRRKRLDVSE